MGEGPKIISPGDRMTYYLDPRAGGLPFQAGSSVDVREHRWYLDDAYLGARRPGDKLCLSTYAKATILSPVWMIVDECRRCM